MTRIGFSVPPLLTADRTKFEICSRLVQERNRQDFKFGPQNHPLETWLAILTEEVGEFAQAILHKRFGGDKAAGLEEEVVQIGAVAMAILEYLAKHPEEKQ